MRTKIVYNEMKVIIGPTLPSAVLGSWILLWSEVKLSYLPIQIASFYSSLYQNT